MLITFTDEVLVALTNISIRGILRVCPVLWAWTGVAFPLRLPIFKYENSVQIKYIK